MSTSNHDLQTHVSRIETRFGRHAVYDLFSRTGCRSLQTLSPAAQTDFSMFAEACIQYDVPPGASWNGNTIDCVYTPYNKALWVEVV